MNFIIYPKKGKPFTLDLDEFKVEQDRITVTAKNSRNDGFLTLDAIAAIVPEKQMTPQPPDRYTWSISVYLKGHVDSPITVFAHAYKYEKDLSEIEFYWKHIHPDYPGTSKIEQVYVLASEVLALVPVSTDK